MFDVNVVIVNYNMREKVSNCLESLFLEIADSGLRINVVVVDNASSDGSLEFLKTKFPDLKYIYLNENKGFGAGQNIGMAGFEAKYHFVLNPDTRFFPGEKTIKKMFDFMEEELKIAMIGPKLVYPDGALQYSCYRFPTLWHPILSRTSWGEKGIGKKQYEILIMKEFSHKEIVPVDWIMGSAMFIRNSALKEVGSFDERFFMYYEDSDLCRRLWERGWAIYYFPEVKIEHHHNRESAKIQGVLRSIFKNKLARIHIMSWMKYMWKWRGNYKFYHA